MWKIAAAVVVSAAAGFGQLLPTAIQPHQVVPCEPITVTRFGPHPDSITRPAGPFMIAIENHSRLLSDRFSLYVKGTAGTTTSDGSSVPSLFDLTAAPGRILDYKLINLQPGEYELVFSNHPKWKVSITITGSGQ